VTVSVDDPIRCPDRIIGRATTTGLLDTQDVLTIPIPAGASAHLAVTITGYNPAFAYTASRVVGAVANSSGVVALGTPVLVASDLNGAIITFVVVGSAIVVRVTGIALTTIQWLASVDVTLYQP